MATFKRLKDGITRFFWRARALGKPGSSRFWWWALGVPVALYALYVIGATVFLCSGAMTSLTEKEEDVHIEVASGYSLFPGRLHLSNLRVQFKDYNVEMAIFAEDAELTIALHRLLQKKIHIHWVRASGVEYQMLHRVKDRKKSAARLAAFPDIPAFDRPAYYDAPRPPRSGKKPWSLRVDSIEAEARFAWVMEYQIRGKMSARGGFYTDPLKKAEVFPCNVELREATISVSDEQIARDVQGSLSFELSPFTVRDAPIEKVLPKISSKVGDFSARIDTLSFMKLYVSTEPLHLQGRGQLEIDTTVTRGAIEPGSNASLELSPLIISAQHEGKDATSQSARGTSQLSFEASSGGHLDVTLKAEVPQEKDGAFSLQMLEAQAALKHKDIRAFQPRGVQIALKNLHYKKPEFLYALLGRSAAIPVSGRFNLHGKADLPEKGVSQLEAKAETFSTSFYFEGQRFGATTETTIRCSGTRKEADCGIDFHAPYLLLDKKPDDEAETIWLRLKTQEPLKVSPEQGTFEGPIVVSGGDPKDAVSEWMGKAWLPQMGLKLVPTGPITGSFTVRKTPARISLLQIDIATGKTRLEGELSSGETTHAIGTIAMPVGRWGFESTPAGVRVRPFIGSEWVEKQ